MSAYGQGRDAEHVHGINPAISDFIARYGANPSMGHKTIILFACGIGSQLMRARTPHQDGPPLSYDVARLNRAIAFGQRANFRATRKPVYRTKSGRK
jgi:hypothetical protein